MPSSVSIRAFAKVNLGLKVLGLRRDGYHEIRTVYQTVDLSDRLTVSLTPRAMGGLDLEAGSAAVPAGRENIVWKAWDLWRRERNFRGSARVRLDKRIPTGAGLGGGSSDAAAMLLALERLTGDRLPWSVRLRLAARLGSDVPFFLWGGRVLGCGRGEEVYPLGDLPKRHCLLAFPGFAVSTPEAYRRLDDVRRLTNRRRDSKMDVFGAWSPFSLEIWGPAENDFEKVVFARWPGLARVKRQLIRAGAEVASLTGSGSALYAVSVSARKLRDACGAIPAGWKVFAARSLSRADCERRRFISAR